MSIEDFLDEMAHRETHLVRYQQTKTQFADDCLREIMECLRSNEFTHCDLGSDAEECNRLVARIHHSSENIFDTIQHFMRHYAKTESISFQIVPEESWNRNDIDVKSIVGSFGDYTSPLNKDSVNFGAEVKEYGLLCMRAKDCYRRIHKILKQKAFEYFPAIIDLPALGLRELDFILFEETHGFME